MNTPLRAHRSKEIPMDFEFTSRPSSTIKPAWVVPEPDTQTPQKRGFSDVAPSTPTFPSTPTRPSFGHQGYPFLFHEPLPQSPHPPAWTPPPNFSPVKAFPQPELPDVVMNDSSPVAPSPEKPGDDGERLMASGGLRRVHKSRSVFARRRMHREEEDGSGDDDDREEDGHELIAQTTNNHVIYNVGRSAPHSDLPFRLLGFVQVFFNGSLAAIAIYLLVQFILTIQLDVEYRIAEYSMDIVQEIAQCQLAYKTNLCAQGTIPAMAAQCAAWETCRNRDPTKVGRAKVSVEVIGEVVNSFVEPISWKTLGFTVAALAFMTLFINSLLMLFRSRVNPGTQDTATPHFPVLPGVSFHGPQGYLPPNQVGNNKSWKYVSSEEQAEQATRRRRLEGGQVAKIK